MANKIFKRGTYDHFKIITLLSHLVAGFFIVPIQTVYSKIEVNKTSYSRDVIRSHSSAVVKPDIFGRIMFEERNVRRSVWYTP